MPYRQYTSNRFEPEEVEELEEYLRDKFILGFAELDGIYGGTVHPDQEAFILYCGATVLNLYVQGPDEDKLDKIRKEFLFLNPKFPEKTTSKKILDGIADDIGNLPVFDTKLIKNSTGLKAELGYLI